ncbi:MAG TPA: precorrin-8X methylmutase [Candidatus Thiothrix moscowensis]|uniref:precorrin-8X methylmutase n=1 Tax=unclassified Thiothrix TaxID=2636184 RepID=UPI001A278E01|nr:MULTISPECIES: precorrin-8X methylmutase [unclassified Thiothrix]MBJ6611480.1 precorrin-8X methylmutase [Candidatus Thiothrix moscowensis]HRJ51959.1 precorrin-8X methylmutase [Candidatus Thiothrix moscowensis]HRJ92274.1 precorrin-8X methylmutase [Candidatus Thiothrix moscowensis]
MQYLRDPERILQQNYANIREQLTLDAFTPAQQQVVIHLVRAYGDPLLAQHILFSQHAIDVALKTIKKRNNILYDVELVRHTLDTTLLYQEPLSFLGKAAVISHAKASKQTRAMTAVDYWKPYMAGSIILIGESATASLRLLEILKEGAPKPALIVTTSRGFVNAEAAKRILWEQHADLGVECIVLAGTRGGGVLAATIMNALLMLQQGIYV